MQSDRFEKCGNRLEQFAKIWNVSFDFQAVVGNWETITPTQLALRHGEVVAISCLYKLQRILDESIKVASPRKMVLNRIRSMNPKVCLLKMSHQLGPLFCMFVLIAVLVD